MLEYEDSESVIFFKNAHDSSKYCNTPLCLSVSKNNNYNV